MKRSKSKLLSSRITDVPSAIFFGAGASHAMDRLTASKLRTAGLNGSFDAVAIETLAMRWDMLADLLRHDLVPAHQRRLILEKNPANTFRALLTDYRTLAHEIEGSLLTDLESVERLVQFFRLPTSPESINGPDFYMALVATDPNRMLRIHDTDVSMDETEGLAAARQFAAEAVVRKYESPAWAFFYLRTQKFDAIDPKLIEVISASDEYCYLAAKLCRQRFIPSTEWSTLATAVKTPRWAYHMLREGLAVVPEQALTILKESPPWLVEYIEAVRMSAEDRVELFASTFNALRAANKLAFLDEFQVWNTAKSHADLRNIINSRKVHA